MITQSGKHCEYSIDAKNFLNNIDSYQFTHAPSGQKVGNKKTAPSFCPIGADEKYIFKPFE